MTRLEQLKKQYQTEEVWAFPKDYADLYDHVKSGRKTATSSYYPRYAYKGRPLPVEKGYSLLLNDADYLSEVLVLRYPEIRIYPFEQVASDVPPAEMMDRATWIAIHQRVFEGNAHDMGQKFSQADLTLTTFMEVIEVISISEKGE